MIDFHCHLDLYPNALELLPKVAERNIFTLVVTTSPRAWHATSRVFSGYKNIKVAVGLHPEIVEKKLAERDLLAPCILDAQFVGEVGLDGSPRYRKTMPLQESILKEVLVECEKAGGKIISIHSRNATSRVLDLIEQQCRNSKPIMHWFSGTIREAHRAITLGCWFSISPAMLKGVKGHAILQELPVDRILPETDGPFTRNGTAPFMPWEAINISKILANYWNMSINEVLAQIKQNSSTLIGYDVN